MRNTLARFPVDANSRNWDGYSWVAKSKKLRKKEKKKKKKKTVMLIHSFNQIWLTKNLNPVLQTFQHCQ